MIKLTTQLIFYQVVRQTEAGETLYLSVWNGEPAWDSDSGNACYWGDEDMAQAFGEDWIEEGVEWEVEEVVVDVNKVY